MHIRAVFLAATLVLAPLAARAADLIVWWEKGFNSALTIPSFRRAALAGR
jgi:hypothetical protein